jgi:hypothetical protein
LLANAVYQPKSMTQTHRLRGQARSYTGFALAHTSRQNTYTGFCTGRHIKAVHEPVGAGLLANAVYQPKSMAQTHRHRGQARSYTGFALADTSMQNPGPVGAGLLANALYQPKTMTQTHRLRGQARSNTGLAWAGIPVSGAESSGPL